MHCSCVLCACAGFSMQHRDLQHACMCLFRGCSYGWQAGTPSESVQCTWNVGAPSDSAPCTKPPDGTAGDASPDLCTPPEPEPSQDGTVAGVRLYCQSLASSLTCRVHAAHQVSRLPVLHLHVGHCHATHMAGAMRCCAICLSLAMCQAPQRCCAGVNDHAEQHSWYHSCLSCMQTSHSWQQHRAP